MMKINKKRITKISILAIVILMPCYLFVFAGDQIRSNVFLIGTGSQTASVSTPVDLPVSFYIGSNLNGVTNPVKNIFFRISGTYTGGGSVQFKINSDSATAKTFILPTVAKSTDFEFIYKDDSGKINPTVAGPYSYTLNVIPSGTVISGLGAKLEITYQFAPTACVDGPSINEKVKSTEFYGGHVDSLGASADLPISIYIGDDLTGISNAVKSVYFIISGVNTGSGGILSANLSGTSTNFLLPSVTQPSNFSILYQDNSGTINPASAGTYNYTLHLSQTGLTATDINVKTILTHRYKPAGCGAGYPPYGDLISAVYDSTANSDGPAYNSILWKGKLGGAGFDQGKVMFQVAVADSTSGPWNYVGGSTCGSGDWYNSTPNSAIELNCFSQLNNKRFFRYKIRICSSDCILSGTDTPIVDDVVVNWSP